jgi:hypothetical protein
LEARIMDRGRPERTTLFEDSQTLVDWEDEAGVNIGSKIQLTPPTAPILGPRLSDLTGGDGDTITLTLDASSLADITGEIINTGFSIWVITFTDASTLTINLNNTLFEHYITEQGGTGAASGSFILNLSDLTPFVGKKIDSVAFNTTGTWTAAGPNGNKPFDYLSSTFQLWIAASNLDSSLHLEVGDSGTLGPGIGRVVALDETLRLEWDFVSSTPAPATVSLPIDATTIKGVATPTQLAEQSNPLEDPIILDNTSLQAYIGWTVTAAVANVDPAGYSPSTMTYPSYLHFVMIFPGHFSSAASNLDNLYETRPLVSDQPVNLKIWDNTVYLGVYFQFSPTDIPGSDGLPLAYTEPLVIRNRSRMSLLVSSPVSPVGYYATPYVWREFSHDGKLWVFIDGSLPDELNAMLVTGQTWQSAGGIPRDLLQVEESVFRGVFSYAWGKQFSGVVWEFVRFGLEIPTEENTFSSVPAIQATFMARE